MKENQYKPTMIACFIAYIVQAIVNNFVPLLFITLQQAYQISLSNITMLVTFNFLVQLVVDLLAAKFVDRIGYRASMVLAHVASASGFILLTFLPEILPNPFIGILISELIYAIGGGLMEVLVSPIVESCPSDHKEKAMSLLHSFYCWGVVGVVLVSTIFFAVFTTSNWKILTLLWAIIPIANMLLFTKVPLAPMLDENENGMKILDLFRNKVFWILLLMMFCSGASELSVSQWASTFAEMGLGVSKTLGDILGPMLFAVTMGTARLYYGKHGEKIDLSKFMMMSGVLCIFSYLGISLFSNPILSLLSCGICGLSVGIMWPGTFSTASSSLPKGGTALFALLALGGDLGGSLGPGFVGIVSTAMSNQLQMGFLFASIFPVLLCVGILVLKLSQKK